MEWISVKERLPDKIGTIIVSINKRYFLGYTTNCLANIATSGDCVLFEIMESIYSMDCRITRTGSGWCLPLHWKEPDYWMYVEPPEED